MKVRRSAVKQRKAQVSPRVESIGQALESASRLIDVEKLVIGLVAGVVLVGGAATYLSPQSRYYRAQQAISVQEKADNDLARQREINRLEARDRETTKAHERYQSGCTMLSVEMAKGSYELVALSADTVYYDSTTDTPMARGEVLCDDNGVTGLVGSDGYLTDIARASDMSFVERRFDDAYGWTDSVLRSGSVKH